MSSEWLQQLYNPVQETSNTLVQINDLINPHSKLDTIINLLAKRIERNYDNVIAITGFEGTGKSTLSIIEAHKLSRRLNMPFSLEGNVIYNPTYESIIHSLTTKPKRSTVIVDEAIKTMYNRNWSGKAQKELNAIFTTIRKRNLSVFLNIPSFDELDSFFKNYRVYVWQHILKRGRATLMIKDTNPLNPDPFNTKLAKKLIDQYITGRDRFNATSIANLFADRLPNYITSFKFGKLSARTEARYDSLAQKFNVEVPAQQKKNANDYDQLLKDSIIQLFTSSPAWTKAKLAQHFKISTYKIDQIIKEARKDNAEADKNEGSV